MVDLLPRLKEKGLDIDILLFDGTDTPFRQQIDSAGIKVFDLGVGGSVYSPYKFLKLIPFLNKYDIIHTHNTAPQLFAAMGSYFSKSKLVTTEHGGSNRRRNIKGFKFIDRWMYNRYNQVICIAHRAEISLKEYLERASKNIITINNGVDISKFVNASTSSDLEHIATKSRKLMMVAGFRWEKDQPTVIKALKFLPDSFHLFLVGDGSRRAELHDLVKSEKLCERVHFLGIRDNIPELLHAADYIVMSSHFEGLSLSSVEGMCVGKPFLASDVDGLREVVQGAGILFPHEDSKALAEEILKLESDIDLYKDISIKCLSRATQFDISRMVDGYLEVYNSL